jgi:hypothetical protein
MKRIALLLGSAATLAGVVGAPSIGKIPPGYRDWKLISVAREEGSLNDIRAILGNDKAIKAYRDGKASFPDGAIIARIAWSHDASEENNKVFGRPQSFVAGLPKNGVQFMVKDSTKYASTGGWGSRTASLPASPCSTPAFRATRRSQLAPSCSPVTRLEAGELTARRNNEEEIEKEYRSWI